MNLLVVLCLVAAVAAAPPSSKTYNPTDSVYITKYDNDNYEPGRYRYAFEQSDGTRAEQSGRVKNEGREDESLTVSGSFSWVGPDGVTYTIKYNADEDGYNPEIEQGPGGAVPAHVASLIG